MPNTLEEHIAALGDRLTIEREIARGGAAVVYLARDQKLERPVAVKLLHAARAEPGVAERFHREIGLLARLQHPNILPLYESGEAAGALFYVMPFVAGLSLRQRLEREKQLPVVDALRIGVQIANALAFAHAQDVVHRDIKPENILLSGYPPVAQPNGAPSPDWHAVVCDFGVARLTKRDAAGVTIGRQTATGITVGSPKYMAPEQASAERHVDGRADVFALGLLLYEMLTGDLPFARTSRTAFEALARRLTEPPPPIERPDIAPALATQLGGVITRALAPDPDKRFPTASALAVALQECLNATAPRASSAPAASSSSSRVVVFIVATVVVAAAIAAFVLSR